ncbi:MAG: DUF4149 domain-containing protein [Acidobacteriota bacterium]
MHALFIGSLWLHLLAVTLWLGGSLFLVFVLMPVVRRTDMPGLSMDLVRPIALRFKWFGWGCFGLLATTGIFNLSYQGIGWERLMETEFWTTSYGRALGWKLGLFGLILLSSAAHDFVIGPRASQTFRENPNSEKFFRLLLTMRWAGRVNLLLALVVVGFAVMLSRGWPW